MITNPHPPAPQPALASRMQPTHPTLAQRAAGTLFFALLLWTALVVYVAVVTNQAAVIGLLFIPAFGIDLLDRIPMGSVLLKGIRCNALK